MVHATTRNRLLVGATLIALVAPPVVAPWSAGQPSTSKQYSTQVTALPQGQVANLALNDFATVSAPAPKPERNGSPSARSTATRAKILPGATRARTSEAQCLALVGGKRGRGLACRRPGRRGEPRSRDRHLGQAVRRGLRHRDLQRRPELDAGRGDATR